MTITQAVFTHNRTRNLPWTLLVLVAVMAFNTFIVLLDVAYYRFASARFPAVGDSAWLATLWGLVSRAHLLVLGVPLVLWRPGLVDFRLAAPRSTGGCCWACCWPIAA